LVAVKLKQTLWAFTQARTSPPLRRRSHQGGSGCLAPPMTMLLVCAEGEGPLPHP
jgi:hypothetical protein